LLIFNETREVFLKEQSNSLYRIPCYFATMIIVELPFQILVSMMFVPPILYFVNLNMSTWTSILRFALIVAASGIAGQSYSVVIGSVATSDEEATNLSMMLYLPSTLFGGFIVN
jgi:hypothetical protein